uniref:DBR1 domain-containing protein n=1 Tax=Panagrellus redivivus TaxID=6233 RepID=A0A7E4USH6_PANRE
MASVPPPPIPPQLSHSDEPSSKKTRIETKTIPTTKHSQRQLHLAVAGCSHGEMDYIYSTLAKMERNRGYKFDLLICCGDYQALRNNADINTINVPHKHRKLGTFHQYYSGEKVAPILTIFIGGNHEATGFMAELPYGGWVAPNIYYLGFASVVQFAGLQAKVPHENAIGFEETKFVALDKPNDQKKFNKFLEAIDIPIAEDACMELQYDPVWLAILKATDELTSISRHNVYLPDAASFKPTSEAAESVKALFDGEFTIPRNFQPTAPPYRQNEGKNEPCLYYRNPQTTEFCDKLGITNLNRLLYEANNECNGIPFIELAARANADGTEVIDVGDDDSGDEYGEEFFASSSTATEPLPEAE